MDKTAQEEIPAAPKDQPRMTKGKQNSVNVIDGLRVSSSEITRLQKQLKFYKEQVCFNFDNWFSMTV